MIYISAKFKYDKQSNATRHKSQILKNKTNTKGTEQAVTFKWFLTLTCKQQIFEETWCEEIWTTWNELATPEKTPRKKELFFQFLKQMDIKKTFNSCILKNELLISPESRSLTFHFTFYNHFISCMYWMYVQTLSIWSLYQYCYSCCSPSWP